MDDTEVGRIGSWVGLDVGKQDHHATVISAVGERLFELAVRNDEVQIERLLDRALESGTVREGSSDESAAGFHSGRSELVLASGSRRC
jgi:Transposase